MADIVVNGNTSGAVTLSAPAVAGTVTVTLPSTTGTMLTTASTTGISGSAISSGTVPEAYGGTGTSTGYYGFKNRIINGAMVIDQRNAGASITPTNGQFSVDRWACLLSAASKYTAQQNAAAVTPPVGFIKYLGITSSSAYSVSAGDYFNIRQGIEGLNVADLAWGTASAATVTLSFWVRSSLTGTFGGGIVNGAGDRSYPYTYTISVANTWEQKTITIAGDTTGTWVTTNSNWGYIQFGLGAGATYSGTAGAWAVGNYLSATGAVSVVGTNGATFYITGVQLEKGSTATSFDYRPIGTELQLCQRYYEHSYSQGTIPAALTTVGAFEFAQQVAASSTQFGASCKFSVVKRTAPTMTFYNWNAAGNQAVNVSTAGVTSGITTRALGDSSFSTTCTTPAGTSAGQTLSMHFTASAEL